MNIIKNFKKLDKYYRLAVIIIILFSIMVFTLTSIYHVSGDACWQVSASRFIAEEQKIPLNEGLGRSEPFWPPPLFHLTSAIVYTIAGGVGNVVIKFVSPVFSILTLIFTFLMVKRIFNTKIGLYTLLFLAFVPLFIDYSVFSYVESMLTFLVVLSVYLAIKNKIILASIAAGLGVLTKYNALFILPLLIYIVYKNNKNKSCLLKRLSIVVLLPLVIASPWLIRNWLVLGNPIWPFLNFIFNGLSTSTYTGLDLSRIVDINLLISTYLGLFGVPNGVLYNLFFFDIPFLVPLLVIWFVGTLIFIMPLVYVFHFKKIRNSALISIWIGLYAVLYLLYILNVSFSVTRIIIPAIPALAIIWAHGFDKILNSRYKKVAVLIFVLVIAGFVFSEFVKITLAANEWSFYDGDFEWVKNNIDKTAVFMAGGQCISYNIDRQTVEPNTNNLKKSDYIFINQNFRLDKRTQVDNTLLSEIRKKSDIVYINEITQTEIYRLK